MEVTISSNISGACGQLTVTADAEDKVEILLHVFCFQLGVQVQKHYQLRNSRNQIMPLAMKIRRCDIEEGDILYLCLIDEKERWPLGCSPWWLLAGVTLVIGGVGLVATTMIYTSENPVEDFGVVIDAGSSHTQLYVYRWNAAKEKGTALAKEIHSCRIKGGGISSYEQIPAAAGPSLQECIEEAKDHVPVDRREDAPIFLGATAGMRLLNASNPMASERIMHSVGDTLVKSGFGYNDTMRVAQIIPGSMEGMFGWITANYLNGSFREVSSSQYMYDTLYGVDVLPTWGAMDLGGASTQLTFVPENASAVLPGYSESVVLYGRSYEVYVHSYLCYGTNEAMRRLKASLVKSQGFSSSVIRNPCAPKGNTTVESYADVFEAPCTYDNETHFMFSSLYKNTTFEFEGQSDTEGCKEEVKKLFDFNKTCPSKPHCSFNGIYQPPVFGNYMAFSGYYYTMSFLNLTKESENIVLENFRSKMDEFCQRNWSDISSIPVPNPSFLISYCFNAHYIDILLTLGYKFDATSWQDVDFVSKVAGSDAGWTLGYMLNMSNSIPAEYPTKDISQPLFVVLMILFSAFVFLSAAFGCFARQKGRNVNKAFINTGSQYGAI